MASSSRQTFDSLSQAGPFDTDAFARPFDLPPSGPSSPLRSAAATLGHASASSPSAFSVAQPTTFLPQAQAGEPSSPISGGQFHAITDADPPLEPVSEPKLTPSTTLHGFLEQFWTYNTYQAEHEATDFKHGQQLPLARIKKVMKSDGEVKMISAEAPILFARACEIFIRELTSRAYLLAESHKRRTIQRSDVAQAVGGSDMFDFLIDLIPREESRPGGGRRAAVTDSRGYYADGAAKGGGGVPNGRVTRYDPTGGEVQPSGSKRKGKGRATGGSVSSGSASRGSSEGRAAEKSRVGAPLQDRFGAGQNDMGALAGYADFTGAPAGAGPGGQLDSSGPRAFDAFANELHQRNSSVDSSVSGHLPPSAMTLDPNVPSLHRHGHPPRPPASFCPPGDPSFPHRLDRMAAEDLTERLAQAGEPSPFYGAGERGSAGGAPSSGYAASRTGSGGGGGSGPGSISDAGSFYGSSVSAGHGSGPAPAGPGGPPTDAEAAAMVYFSSGQDPSAYGGDVEGIGDLGELGMGMHDGLSWEQYTHQPTTSSIVSGGTGAATADSAAQFFHHPEVGGQVPHHRHHMSSAHDDPLTGGAVEGGAGP